MMGPYLGYHYVDHCAEKFTSNPDSVIFATDTRLSWSEYCWNIRDFVALYLRGQFMFPCSEPVIGVTSFF